MPHNHACVCVCFEARRHKCFFAFQKHEHNSLGRVAGEGHDDLMYKARVITVEGWSRGNDNEQVLMQWEKLRTDTGKILLPSGAQTHKQG